MREFIKSQYDGYEVSPDGFVRSVDRDIPINRNETQNYMKSLKGKLLEPRKNKTGGLMVSLYDETGKPKTVYVHRLVAENFIPNPNNYDNVLHKDGDKNNNKVENLIWTNKRKF